MHREGRGRGRPHAPHATCGRWTGPATNTRSSPFATPSVEGSHTPDPKYMEQVVRGARHWSLPTGWVAGLEDLGEDALI